QQLLDAVLDYLPTPLDRGDVVAVDPRDLDKEVVVKSDATQPFAALAFKIMNDPFVGMVTFFRVYSGTLTAGDQVQNPSKGKKERLTRLLLMHANKREEITTVKAGDIAAAVGLKFTTTGDTLCTEGRPVLLEKIDFPEPVISVAIEPKTKADQEKLADALKKLAMEDPSFHVTMNDETGQTLLSGMGELHLEILVDRMKREYKVESNVGRPQVSYRETVSSTGVGEGRFVREIGGKGQFGQCVIKVAPKPRGQGYSFVNRMTDPKFPKNFIMAIDQGLQDAMQGGIIVGYPAIDIEVTLESALLHETDSNEVAFKIAASMAFKEACRQAKPVLLEPMMTCEVLCPDDYMGGVIGDLNA
ncbi:MAG: elongation factor G, partial [Proteobacteria bacterium]